MITSASTSLTTNSPPFHKEKNSSKLIDCHIPMGDNDEKAKIYENRTNMAQNILISKGNSSFVKKDYSFVKKKVFLSAESTLW